MIQRVEMLLPYRIQRLDQHALFSETESLAAETLFLFLVVLIGRFDDAFFQGGVLRPVIAL